MQPKANTRWEPWVILVITFSLCGFGCSQVLSCAQTMNPEHHLRTLPLGSTLDDLDDYIDRVRPDYFSDSKRWVRADSPLEPAGPKVETDIGTFVEQSIGPYDLWQPAPKERATFTGEIRFHEWGFGCGDFPESSFMVGLVYIQGRLVKKRWHCLPG